jgi:hypothetical protein
MEINMKKTNYFWRRMAIYIIGLCIYAFGACLTTKANVGISPITSVSYIFTIITNLSLGITTFIMNIVLIGIQMLLMGKEFDKKQYMQIVISVIFSIFVDGTMLIANLFAPVSLINRTMVFVLAIFIMSIGISLILMTKMFVLPADGVATTLAYKFKWDFGKSKVITDCCMVIITIIVSLAALGRIEGIQVGTVVTALMLGNIARVILKIIRNPINKFINNEEVQLDTSN